MESDLILYSVNAIRSMEVIDICTGSKLGFIRDFKFNVIEQKLISIILPAPVKSWFSKEADIEIPWDKVVKIGVDVLLVDGSDIQFDEDKNNI